jgi:hypothetical protein
MTFWKKEIGLTSFQEIGPGISWNDRLDWTCTRDRYIGRKNQLRRFSFLKASPISFFQKFLLRSEA